MIQRMDQTLNLAVVGLSVVLPGGGGIDEFGRLLYRGMPITGRFEDKASLELAATRAIKEVCGEARLETEKLAVISLSPVLTRILLDRKLGSRVQEVLGVSTALTIASEWVESSEEEVVLLVEAQEDPLVFCGVLIMDQKFARDNSKPIYARVVGAAEVNPPFSAASLSGAINEARRASGTRPEATGLIEAATLKNGSISNEEAGGLLGINGSTEPTSCALGSSMGGLLGFVQTVWCLSQRVIPCTPGWSGPESVETWQNSSYYVGSESRAWFIPSTQDQRYAGINLLAPDGGFSHILLSDTRVHTPKHTLAPTLEALHLFPIAFHEKVELPRVLAALQSKITAGASMADVAQETYQQYLAEKQNSQFVLSFLGTTPDELTREIGFAAKGIPTSFENMSDWQTPLGSFFTPGPLGMDGKVCFVYPGAFNSYPGIGRDLFYLYPNLYEQLSEISDDIGNLLNEQRLYPRSISPLTSDDLTSIEAQLNADPITMLISGSCLAFLYTEVLRNIFQIRPASAFGYSLGEVSMLFASRVWTDADGTSMALRESPLFRTRLTGPQNAVREYWKLPTRSEDDPPEALWGNFLLMTGPEKVKEVLADETKVYLTHINTPRQVVIGGDPVACRRVINKLKCKSIPAPFNYAIHCEPIHSEYKMLMDLHSVPVMNQPGMTLYSAATYKPMPIDQQIIAEQIAQELCHCLDFPRLIQRAYHDGARVFVELGAGSNCARWVNDTLQDQQHGAYSINRKGVDDHTSILRLLARMVSQQVPIDLSMLYQD
jgi:PfaB family protein